MGETSVSEIYRLPEGCISHVISLTSPRDSCRSALVSTTFRSAAESDTVWERFLPPDYEEILSRAVAPVEFSTKRDLYFRLCDPILVDAGKMSFALEKSTGAKCYTISARELVIVWGDTPQYWRWVHHPDSRFSEVAELLHVCWLEIRGKIDCRILSPKTNYAAYLIFKTVQGSHGLGFPVQQGTVRVGTHVSNNTVCLQPDEAGSRRMQSMRRRFMIRGPQQFLEMAMGADNNVVERAPSERNDGWMEMELGDFFNDDRSGIDVEMSLTEVVGGHWKSGLIILGIEVRPKK